MHGVKANSGVGMENARLWNPAISQFSHFRPWHGGYFTVDFPESTDVLPRVIAGSIETPSEGKEIRFFPKLKARPWYKAWGRDGLWVASGRQPMARMRVHVGRPEDVAPGILLTASASGQTVQTGEIIEAVVEPGKTLRVTFTVTTGPEPERISDIEWTNNGELVGKSLEKGIKLDLLSLA